MEPITISIKISDLKILDLLLEKFEKVRKNHSNVIFNIEVV